ncbi:glyoxalase/bleomycin resistance/dioxygenase family protein [Streptomyces nojiriensis]
MVGDRRLRDSKLFGVEPAKIRPGYANFAVAEPPLKIVLIEGEAGEETRLDHLGVEVEATEQVTAATFEERDTSCCYAVQDKVWVTGPGKEHWEVYVVKGEGGRRPARRTPAAPPRRGGGLIREDPRLIAAGGLSGGSLRRWGACRGSPSSSCGPDACCLAWPWSWSPS